MKNLRAGLIRIAKAIGRWLLKRLARWVKTTVIHYMEMRLADWAERKHPPKRRIRRWEKAVAWLKAQLTALEKVAAHEYDALADELEQRGVPEVAA